MQQSVEPSNASPVVLMNPAGLYDPTPNGYSHVAAVAPGMRLIYVAGQGGETEDGRLTADFRLQVRQALSNLRMALAAAGAGTDDIAKLTVLVVDHSEERLHEAGLYPDSGAAPRPRRNAVRGRSRRRPPRIPRGASN